MIRSKGCLKQSFGQHLWRFDPASLRPFDQAAQARRYSQLLDRPAQAETSFLVVGNIPASTMPPI